MTGRCAGASPRRERPKRHHPLRASILRASILLASILLAMAAAISPVGASDPSTGAGISPITVPAASSASIPAARRGAAIAASPRAAIAASPSMPPLVATVDPRSEGSGPGLVGSPIVVLLGVVLLGLASAAVTLVLAHARRSG